MDYILGFGKAKKSKSPKRKSTGSKKLSKKMLDSLSLKKLKALAKKYKVSCYKKGTKVCVKKSTLLVRLKKSRSVNKILKSASLMKKSKRRSASPKRKASPKRRKASPKRRKASPKRRKASPKRKRTSRARFGEEMNPMAPNTPRFMTPLELSLGQTYEGQKRHYNKIPSTLISQNFQGTGAGNPRTRMQMRSENFPWTQGSMGRSSLPSFKNINDPAWASDPNRFGRYFR